MTENEKKYGTSNSDIIALQFIFSQVSGVSFCFGNIQKYLRRYDSLSEKSSNEDDIAKVLDYVKRVEKELKPYKYNSEIIFLRLKRLIKNKEYKVAYIHAIDLQKFILEKLNK